MGEAVDRRSSRLGDMAAWAALWKAILCTVVFLNALGIAPAQQLDSVAAPGEWKANTVADEITDAAERKAYLALYKARSPAEKGRRAEAFVAQYPQSWALPQAYEIAARALMDSGKYSAGLRYARASLRIYPENFLLLVVVANVEDQVGKWQEAERDAQQALRGFERFTRPASVPGRSWPELRRKLEASAHFALGRAEVSMGLDAGSRETRLELFGRAQHELGEAIRRNPSDPEISYLRGLAEIALSQPWEAALSFALAARQAGPLQTKALTRLRQLYLAYPPQPKVDFEDYCETLAGWAELLIRSPSDSPSYGNNRLLPAYAGSKTCRTCHADIYQCWLHTGMARMLRPYQARNVIGDFTNQNRFYAGDHSSFQDGSFRTEPADHRWPFARMVVIKGHPYFKTKEFDGRWRFYAVDYTIGSKWQQAYATRLPDGELQVLPIEYNARLRQWVNYWKLIDPPGSPRADLRLWGKSNYWTNYQMHCAVCHTSQLRGPTTYQNFEPQAVAFREPGVDCEMCHGPSARHVAAMRRGEPYEKTPMDPPVDFTRISATDFMAICAQCHMQSAVRLPGPQGELNYSTRGQFFARYKSRPYDEFSRIGFYKDGRFRQTTFIVEALMRSQCYQVGHVTCGSCHDVHGPATSRNPTSLRFPPNSNEMCTQCHTAFKSQQALIRHTHHAAATEGSRCASCHMPRIMDALLFLARTHQIDDIPNAENTLRFGQDESPNACLLCHVDRNARWAQQQLLTWRESVASK
jgi:predicted CXXCH cytochrome family protein